MYQISLEGPGDGPEIETLLDLSFGAERRQRPAYRLREHGPALPELCFIIRDNGRILASIRFWPVTIAGETRSLLLGPLAVESGLRGLGLGRSLIGHGLDRAKTLGYASVLVIGEADYYRPFGFSPVLVQNLLLPAAPTSGCFQGCELVPGALQGLSGPVRANPVRAA